jgi:type I restriction enzyme S subunit
VEVKPGYKQTDMGVVPEDWEVSPLEMFTSFISYGFTNPMPASESGVYMVTARDINNGRVLFDTARRTTEEAYRMLLTDKSRPKKGDILLTKDGTLGRLALVDERKLCINQSVAVLRPNSKAVPEFLKVLLEAPVYQNRMLEDAGGSTIKHIYITIVNLMPLAVPPTKAEQAAIAEALSDADALIEYLEQLIVKKRHLKQGAMQELLTGRKHLHGFGASPNYNQTEGGVIPAD